MKLEGNPKSVKLDMNSIKYAIHFKNYPLNKLVSF